jgi:transglutaminase-like putative cysteine protease
MAGRSDPAELLRKQSHISVQRYFEISLLLMLGTAFVTLATTGKLDLVSIVVVTGALLAKLSSYARDVDYSLSPRQVTHLAIFYIFFYGLDFLIFASGPGPLDRMLQATVHLILFVTVIKVFSARSHRDYAYLATLSFLMMLASAVLTVGANYLACFTLYMLFAISTFISYDIKRATEAARRPPEGPFPAPAENRTALEKALTATTVGLAFGIVALAAVLFFIIPRYRTGYFTGMGMEAQNITGFTESVNLGDLRKILRSSVVVMRVKVVDGSARSFQGIKWRGVALNSFDGKHWYNDNTKLRPLTPVAPSERPGEWDFQFDSDDAWHNLVHHPLRYRVLLSPLSTDVLFAAAVPRQLTGHFRLINLDETDSLHNPQHGYAPLGYDMVSETGLPSPTELRRASTEYPSDLRLLYLNLPQLDPRIAQLARQVSVSATNPYDRALAIEKHLRSTFGYSLDPPAIEPKDPIGSFLFKSKQGYCEYFAAAMAVMLRTLGIPSRLVNGFQTGSYNRVGKDFVVRARDAHSWVEVYFPPYGWVPFDPTPADPNPVLPGALDDYLDTAGLFWNEWVINYDFAHQVRLAGELEQNSRRFQRDVRQRFFHFQRQGVRAAYGIEAGLMSHKLLVLLIMSAILAALLAVEQGLTLAELRLRWAWKFGGESLKLGPREATLTYARFLKVLRKRGFRKTPAQTPREFALSFAGSHLSTGVQEFTRLYNSVRFGKATVPLTRLRDVLEEINRE